MARSRTRRAAAPPAAAAASRVADAPLPRAHAVTLAVALLLAWAVVFAPQLSGRAFVLGDAAAYRPYAEFSRARWAQAHERTFWNPDVFLGLPSAASLADPRPQWLPGPLLSLSDAAAPLADRWRVPLAVLAGALAMAALARSLWRCGAAAMGVAGAGWLLAPLVIVPLAFGHDAEVWTLALWPGVALAARGTLAGGARPWGAALALAALLALQALGAHPQFLAYGLLATAVLAAPLVRRASWPARGALLAAVALGAAMSAAVWLPAMRYGAVSVRASQALMQREALAFCADARDLLSAVWPHAAGFGDATYWGGMRATDYPHFLGAAVVALALAGAFTAAVRSRGTSLALVALAVFALLASEGGRTPLGGVLAALPVTRAFRTPITWVALAQFAAALLAARGMHAARGEGARVAVWAGAAAALAGVALLAAAPGAGAYADVMTAARAATGGDAWPARAAAEAPLAVRDLGLRLLLAGAALALTFGRARLPASLGRAALPLAAALAAFDLGLVAAPIAWHASGPAARLAAPAPTAFARVAAADPLHRVLSLDRVSHYSNDWVAWRVRSVSGLHGAAPARWNELHATPGFTAPGMLRAMGVRWILPPAGESLLPEPFHVAGWIRPVAGGAFENPAALPRAHAVPRVLAVPRDEDVLASLPDPRFAPESLALTTDASAAGDYAAPANVAIAWNGDAPDDVALRVTSPARAFVVLADLWMPGWSATLDGAPLVIHRVDHLLRGVAVPGGTHDVRFRYVPDGWRAGVTLAWAGWLVLAACTAAWAASRGRMAGPAGH